MGIIWDWLRLSRSGPFGVAAQDEQAAGIFRAALQQFEDLMRAAVAAGPAARPLPLFYALSQAGRAIIATRGNEQHDGHGLTLGEPGARCLGHNDPPGPEGPAAWPVPIGGQGAPLAVSLRSGSTRGPLSFVAGNG